MKLWNVNKGLTLHNIDIMRYQEAIDCYDKALELDPDSIIIKACKAEALLFCSRYTECESLCIDILHDIHDQDYKFPIRILLLSSFFLQRRSDAREEAFDVVEFCKSLPLGSKVGWIFDGLRKHIEDSSLGSKEKRVLLLLMDIASVNTENERKQALQAVIKWLEKMNINILTRFQLKKPLPQAITSARDTSGEDIEIASKYQADKLRKNHYDWEIYIHPPRILSSIKRVKYNLHSISMKHTYLISDRENAFKLKFDTSGEFQVEAQILFNDDSMIRKYQWLKPNSESLESQEIANSIRASKLELIKQGKVLEFNSRREHEERYENTDLDLSLVDLSSARLKEINFSKAILSGSRLGYANLSRARLNNSDLTNADLSYADLTNADLSYADLTNADLSSANLSEAKMHKVVSKGAYLSLVVLTNADLSYADLTNADLSYADLTNADLSYADLTNAGMNFTLLVGVKKYEGMKCKSASFSNCIIDNTELLLYLQKNGARDLPDYAQTDEAKLRQSQSELGFS
jgi:uncharacterized protein YjbI with pentapeptide repeats